VERSISSGNRGMPVQTSRTYWTPANDLASIRRVTNVDANQDWPRIPSNPWCHRAATVSSELLPWKGCGDGQPDHHSLSPIVIGMVAELSVRNGDVWVKSDLPLSRRRRQVIGCLRLAPRPARTISARRKGSIGNSRF
jgi:hypothetical protein